MKNKTKTRANTYNKNGNEMKKKETTPLTKTKKINL